jgi:exodeoxyribonuclease-5
MIPDYKPGSRDLLSDLMKFVYEFEFNKTIFIGDTAQLPPVGLEVSPALDLKYLKSNFNLNVFTIELTEVIRQAEKSGILKNATLLRSKINSEDFKLPFFDLDFTSDIKVLPGYELQEELESSYYNQGYEETVLITRSNKRAYLYNMEIRKRILQKEEEIDAGDMLMIVKNNYFWLDEKSKAGFLANGDILEITNVLGVEEKYGFRFADIQARLVDYPEEVEYGFKIILDTLKVEAASFTREENNRLFQEILNKYSDEPSKVKRMKKLKEDKYFNALQVKYAYGLTCHKTQGGQWTNVFIDFPFVKEDEINLDYLRWLYTAVTRAKENVFLINFPENFY